MAGKNAEFNPLLENPVEPDPKALEPSLQNLAMAGESLEAHRSYLERLQRMPQLTCLDGPARGAQVWIEAAELRVGRGYNCHFVLLDPAVAPLHARIIRLPGGTYHLSSTDPIEAPILIRRNGRYKPSLAVHLKDGMVIRLGRRGPRLRFRFLGEPEQASFLMRQVMAFRYDEPLLPEPVLRERLGEVWRTAPLKPVERHTLQQALRYLSPLRFYRRGFFLWTLVGLFLCLLLVSRQLLLSDVRNELATVQRQLGALWMAQTSGGGGQGEAPLAGGSRASLPNSSPRQNRPGDASPSDPGRAAGGAMDTGGADPGRADPGRADASLSDTAQQTLIQSDPIGQQVLRIMRTAGVQQPVVSLGMLNQIQSEIEKEVQRIKHRFEIAAFQARSQKYQPRIEDIFRRELQLPPLLARLAWLESDYRLEAEGASGGLGMWQLSEDVALEYGLITDQGEDFRMDFEASTRGAGRYLADLLTRFGLEQLPLVIAAFHLGPDVVENTLRKHQLWRQEQRTFPYLLRLAGTGDADTLSVPQLQYVSRFFAVQILSENQQYYFNTSAGH